MVFSLNFGLLFAAAMLISSIGFKNYVWFISLGYGFSIAGEGLLMLFLYGDKLTLGTIYFVSIDSPGSVNLSKSSASFAT